MDRDRRRVDEPSGGGESGRDREEVDERGRLTAIILDVAIIAIQASTQGSAFVRNRELWQSDAWSTHHPSVIQ